MRAPTRKGARIEAPGTRWLLPVAVYAAILGASSITGDRLGATGLPGWMSYVAHAVEYAVLGAALRWAARDLRRPLVVTLALGVACGTLDEAWQSTVPGRHPSPVDLAVDVGAVTVAALVLGRWVARR